MKSWLKAKLSASSHLIEGACQGLYSEAESVLRHWLFLLHGTERPSQCVCCRKLPLQNGLCHRLLYGKARFSH